MSRNGRKENGSLVPFFALPWVVLNSGAYRSLGHASRSLLIDIGKQYNGKNNGRLVACMRYLSGLGWNSHDTVTRNLRHLVATGILIETRKGGRPNKASWHALAWLGLDVDSGLDIDPKKYQRGEFLWTADNRAPLIPPRGVR